MDIVDSETRSKMMAAVRRQDTRPEMTVRRALHAAGLRYRLQRRDLPGRPDIVLASRRAAIFVHGCYWHRHNNCKYASVPSTRVNFWQAKFRANTKRDQAVVRKLQVAGWTVLVVWECECRDSEFLNKFVARVLKLKRKSVRAKSKHSPTRIARPTRVEL